MKLIMFIIYYCSQAIIMFNRLAFSLGLGCQYS